MKMHSLSPHEVLNVWEAGLTQTWTERALALLSASYPDANPDGLAKLSIGERDAELVRLRERLFGSQITGLSHCPGCGLCLEFALNTSEVLSGTAGRREAGLTLDLAGYCLRIRPPNSEDLMAFTCEGDDAAARQQMLERCVISSTYLGKPAACTDLPSEIVDALSDKLAKSDPLSDISLAMSCPQCERRWQAAFDIVSFLWSEIEVWARLILRDVHILASAYGWAEQDILALSPFRRQLYLEMAGL